MELVVYRAPREALVNNERFQQAVNDAPQDRLIHGLELIVAIVHKIASLYLIYAILKYLTSSSGSAAPSG